MADQPSTVDIKEEFVDFEFVKVDSQDVHQLCAACLCATRATRTLNDGALKQYYMDILNEMQADDSSFESLTFCWECESLMKRAVRFRERAKLSYKILYSASKEDFYDHLMKKAKYPGRLMTCHCYSIDISPSEQGVSPEVPATVVKQGSAAEILPVPFKDEVMPDNNDNDEEEDVDDARDTDDDDDGPVELRAGTSCDVSGPNEGQKETIRKTGTTINDLQQNVKSLISGNNPYQCLVCLKTFTREKAIVGHMRQHTGEKPHSCQKAIARQQNLITPIKSHSSGVKSQCGVCSISLSQISELKSPDAAEKTFKCDVCSKTYKMKGGLMELEKTDTGEKTLRCEVCSMSFINIEQLKEHKTTHKKKPVKRFQCEICAKLFKVNSKLMEHMRSHTGEKPFKCEVCSKRYYNKCLLKKHMVIHAEVKPYKCGHCSKAFVQKKDIVIHLQKMHTFRKILECKGCKQTFKHLATFREHKKTHKGQKAYQCQLCSKAFTQYHHMTMHMRSHTGERPFQCEFCPKAFTNKSGLLQHRRKHTGEKPYKCKVCLRPFSQISSLGEHMRRLHSGEKPFQCDMCKQAFSLKHQMESHLKKIHSGEKK